MAKLFDLVKVNIATTGTGTVTFGSVFSPEFFTPSEVGAADGDTVRYVLIDGTDIELGTGVIGGSVTTMTRTVTRSRIGGTAGTTKITLSGTAYLALTAAAADILTPELGKNLGHLYGLTLSNNTTDATNDIDIAAGEAADADGNLMVLASGITKRLDAAWAVGTGNGGLDTGTVADAGYHVWLIQRSDTGVVDVLFSTSATSPTMPTSYDRKRRIGWIVRASGAIRGFIQNGDKFILKTPVAIANAYSLTTTSALFAFIAPGGLSVEVEMNALIFGSASISVLVQSPLVATQAANSPAGNVSLINVAGSSAANKILVTTDTSGQVRAVSSVASGAQFYMIQTGWVDTRGRLN
jgi:hypothetical protein